MAHLVKFTTPHHYSGYGGGGCASLGGCGCAGYGDAAEEAQAELEARAAAGLAKIYTVGIPVLLGLFVLSSWAALKVK